VYAYKRPTYVAQLYVYAGTKHAYAYTPRNLNPKKQKQQNRVET